MPEKTELPAPSSSFEAQQEMALLHYFRSEIKFESGLIAERVSALLNSQAFLVIAYAGAMSTATLRPQSTVLLLLPSMLCLLGLTLSVLAWPGIRAAHEMIDRWAVREQELHDGSPALQPFHLDSDDASKREVARRAYQGSLFSRRAPFAFIVAWCCFGALSVGLYLF